MRSSSRRRSALVAIVALLGLTAGWGLRTVLTSRPSPPWTAVLTATAADARLDPTGVSAVVDLQLLTSEPVTVTAAAASGAGIAAADHPLVLATSSRPMEPGSPVQLQLRRLTVPLRCLGTPQVGIGPARLTVVVTTATGVHHEVATGHDTPWITTPMSDPATPSAQPESLCSFAASVLPAGWEHPAVVDSFRLDPAHPARAVLRVSGLTGGSRVVTAQADGPVLAQPLGTPPGDGTATLLLTVVDGCPDLPNRDYLGVTLLAGFDVVTSQPHYVPVGIPMARWLLDHRAAHCTPVQR